jgi:hypothetical protein
MNVWTAILVGTVTVIWVAMFGAVAYRARFARAARHSGR